MLKFIERHKNSNIETISVFDDPMIVVDWTQLNGNAVQEQPVLC